MALAIAIAIAIAIATELLSMLSMDE